MTDLVKQTAPIIWDKIQKSQNILLHCHPNPDPDSMGSTLALMHTLTLSGKNVTVIKGDSDLRLALSALPGFEKIIQKNYFEIDISQFDLFLILDSSSLNQVSKLGEITFPDKLETVVIDHHISNTNFAKTNLVDNSYSSVCQIVYELIREWGLQINREAAVCLYTGMYTDSGGFKYPPTDAQTLLAASELAKTNPEFPQVIFELENNNEAKQVEFLAIALNSIKHYFSNQVAVSEVPNFLLKEKNILPRQTEKMEVANILKSVKGWKLGISFVEIEPNIINVSLRTQDPNNYAVSKIAVATGFGGGHVAAAGATLPMGFEEGKKLLLSTIQKVYPDLGNP